MVIATEQVTLMVNSIKQKVVLNCRSVYDHLHGRSMIQNSMKVSGYIDNQDKHTGNICTQSLVGSVSLPSWASEAFRKWVGHFSGGSGGPPPEIFFLTRRNFLNSGTF